MPSLITWTSGELGMVGGEVGASLPVSVKENKKPQSVQKVAACAGWWCLAPLHAGTGGSVTTDSKC